VLEQLQGYTKRLQTDKQIIHTLHAEMFTVARKVLKLFIHADLVLDDSVQKLISLKDRQREKSASQ
jgi:hypothetical protein